VFWILRTGALVQKRHPSSTTLLCKTLYIGAPRLSAALSCGKQYTLFSESGPNSGLGPLTYLCVHWQVVGAGGLFSPKSLPCRSRLGPVPNNTLYRMQSTKCKCLNVSRSGKRPLQISFREKRIIPQITSTKIYPASDY
jgi:hypothetical protein